MKNSKIIVLVLSGALIIPNIVPSVKVSAITLNNNSISINEKKEYQNIIKSRGNILTDEDFYKIDKIITEKEKNNVKINDTEILKLIIKEIENKESKPQPRAYNIFGQRVTKTELALVATYPYQATKIFSNSKKANDAANKRYKKETLWKGNGDAFRHAYWNVLNRNSVGERFSKMFSTAHESEASGIDKTMDLKNNEIGIRLGAYTTDPETVVKYVNNGWLWRIVNNKLKVTDSSGRK